MRKAIVVGLTGQTGAGKSTVADMFSRFGFAVIDSDVIARAVTDRGSPVLKDLADAFGKDILDDTGTLKRDLLAARAFSSTENTKTLNRITHPEIVRRILNTVTDKFLDGYEAVVVDAPQLFESGLGAKCNVIVSVTASEALRQERIMARDHLSEAEASLRMKAQLSEDFFREHSDIVIENTGDEESLHEQVLRAARILEEVISGERQL